MKRPRPETTGFDPARDFDRRGVCGLSFWCDETTNSLGVATRELARACHRLGYDTGIELFNAAPSPSPSWARTSIRHLLHRPRAPQVCVTWGWGQIADTFAGCPRVAFEVYDGWDWSKPGLLQNYTDHVAMLCLTDPQGVDAWHEVGYTKPVVQVPLGVNTSIFQPYPRDDALLANCADWRGKPPAPDTFVFLVAGYLQHRKGVPVALEAFRKAFSPADNVALLVKGVVDAWGRSQKATLAGQLPGYRLGLCERNLSEWEFARLLASVDCYVSPHHQEGFGLIPLQAMAAGTPVACTHFAGPTQYLDGRNALTWPATLTTVPKDVMGAPPHARWGAVKPADVARVLRKAATTDTGAQVRAGLETAHTWTWENAAQKLCDAIQEHVAPLRRRPLKRVPQRSPGTPLSIIAPVRNGAKHVARFADTASRTQWPGEVRVWLLDDASEDAAGLLREAAAHGAQVLRSEAWLGEWGQRARTPEVALAGHVFLTDVDVEFTDPQWARRCMETLERVGERSVVHPVMLLPNGRVWSAGGTYNAERPCLHEHASQPVPDGLRDKRISYAPGAGWFLTADLAGEFCPEWIGGYHPTVFADVDMALWLRVHGVQFWRSAAARVTHHHGSFTATLAKQQSDNFTKHAGELDWWWADFMAHDRRCLELGDDRCERRDAVRDDVAGKAGRTDRREAGRAGTAQPVFGAARRGGVRGGV